MRWPISLRPLALACAALLLLSTSLGSATVPVELPSYVSPTNEAVVTAARAGTTQGILYRLRDQLAVASIPRERLRISLASLESDEARELWREGRQVAFLAFDPWTVPDDPAWDEDPFESQAWLRLYHSLAWLKAPFAIYEETGDDRYRQEALWLLTDWVDDNPRDEPASPRSWYDHATAYRADLMVELLSRGLLDGAEADDIDIVLGALSDHAEVLAGYLDHPRFVGHNHGLFHALSLYNVANAVPELEGSSAWRTAAVTRIAELLGEMVVLEEGASNEQATAYHILALRLFDNAQRLLAANREPLPDEVRDVLGRMVEVASLMVSPIGTLPARGDTSFGTSAPMSFLRDLQSDGFVTPVSQFMLTQGEEGVQPPELSIYPGGGIVLARTDFDVDGGWEDNAQVMMDIDSHVAFHGHYDSLSYMYTVAGWPFIVDPGGPYAYGEEPRRHLKSAGAHNAVVRDGAREQEGSVRVTHSGVDPLGVSWTAELDLGDGTALSRSMVLLRGDRGLVVVDAVEPSAEERTSTYDVTYQLAPETVVEGDGPWDLRAPSGASLTLEMMSSLPLTTSQAEDAWVTTGLRRQQDAPALSATADGGEGWIVSVLRPMRDERRGVPTTIEADDEAITVTVPRVGTVHVTRDGTVTVSE